MALELKELQRFQQVHDEKFRPDVLASGRAKQIERCTLHLAKVSSIFITYCEKMSGRRTKVLLGTRRWQGMTDPKTALASIPPCEIRSSL